MAMTSCALMNLYIVQSERYMAQSKLLTATGSPQLETAEKPFLN